MLAITERINAKTVDIDLKNGAEIAKMINDEDKKVARAINRILPHIGEAIDKIADRLRRGGRMAYFGAGTSGRLGFLDASEMPPTFGVCPEMVQAYIAGGQKAIAKAVENSEDSAELAQNDFNEFNPSANDVVVGISAGGNPQYVVKVMQLAQQRGVLTIAISSNPKAKIKDYADIFLNPVVGPEAITGSSRMKSGTAQKMILNMLSTGAMIKIGKTYHNYMVDLAMSNAKLRDRALRFVMEITGADSHKSQQALDISGNVKIACVMIKHNCSRAKAQELLEQNGGILRRIIG